jgi:thiol-disulfide isomerase/thioredoxin
MKKIFLALLISCSIGNAFSQGYEVIREGNNHILKGFISRDLLEKDTTYKWYASSRNGYTPNAEALTALTKDRDSIQLLVFMGTWCGDSHFIIPKFYSLTDAAGFSQDRITLLGVDRRKKTISHLTEALEVKNVPTIIVMKNGKELGRVVEYGKYGMWDKELGEIIRSGD